MSPTPGPPLLIAAPSLARGRKAVLGRLQVALGEAGQDFATRLADRSVGARQLAREAASEGRDYVIAVGGDRTVHEVVNGLVDAATGRAHREGLLLGVVAGAAGCDFVRTFGLDLPPERMVRHLTGEGRFPIDLGRVRCRGADGADAATVFANLAQVGAGVALARTTERLPRWLGRVRQLTGGLLAARSPYGEVGVALGHTEVREPLGNVVVANGQFFADGLKVAPRALPDDGLFNVQCWQTRPGDVASSLPRLRVGEHLGGGEVREYQSATVEVTAGGPLPVEADGQRLGTTPATFDVLERVLDLKV